MTTPTFSYVVKPVAFRSGSPSIPPRAKWRVIRSGGKLMSSWDSHEQALQEAERLRGVEKQILYGEETVRYWESICPERFRERPEFWWGNMGGSLMIADALSAQDPEKLGDRNAMIDAQAIKAWSDRMLGRT